MDQATFIALCGFLLNLPGLFLVFKYGLPSRLKNAHSEFGSLADSEMHARRQKRQLNGSAGLLLLCVGFGLIIAGILMVGD